MMTTHDKFMLIIGTTIVVGFFGLLITLLNIKTEIINVDLLNIAMGGLITAFITIVNYYFGSSHGSKVKSDTIDKIINEPSNYDEPKQ